MVTRSVNTKAKNCYLTIFSMERVFSGLRPAPIVCRKDSARYHSHAVSFYCRAIHFIQGTLHNIVMSLVKQCKTTLTD